MRWRLLGCVMTAIASGAGDVFGQSDSAPDPAGQEGYVLEGTHLHRGMREAPSRAAPNDVWRRWQLPGLVVLTAHRGDGTLIPQLLDAIESARRELEGQWGFELPEGIEVLVHPDLASFQAASGMPWYVAGIARSGDAEVHLQRLRVLQERGGLRVTVRHELFHLAQPAEWPRWLAEGAAMIFAGEVPAAPPLRAVSDSELDKLLARPPSRETLLRAQATAYRRALSSPALREARRR